MSVTVVGLNAKLYYNAGTYDVPDWQLVRPVKDVTQSLEMGEADVTSRGANGWRQSEPTLADGSLEFSLVWAPGDPAFTVMQSAFFARTAVEILALDGPYNVTGSQGLRATMKVFNFSRDEQLEEALTANVTLKPAYEADHPPAWFTAS